MTMMFLDGAKPECWTRLRAAKEFAASQGWDANATHAWTDRALYHPDNPRDYGSTIGMPDGNGGMVCVGCWWCEGDRTAAHVYLTGEAA
jgi:hypothetical protein